MATNNARSLWEEKLAFFLREQAITTDPEQRFTLHQHIQEAEAKIRDLRESRSSGNVCLTEIYLQNIRCFKNLKIALDADRALSNWVMVLGDNAAGKTTLLRSLALGLCNEADATAMIKEVPGSILRQGETKGFIETVLRREEDGKRLSVRTTITRESESAPEIVRQETKPAKNFPWNDIFVCGYGTQRATQAHTSFDRYSPLNALRTLFDDRASLQNPEVVLLRRSPAVRRELESRLLEVLMLDGSDNGLRETSEGLTVRGPWGEIPLASLSDGYRSTIQWILDFVGWQIYTDRFGNGDAGGILLIDEIEQHLHPRWQRHIVQRLRKQFPKTQIFSTTHTPLAALGVVDVEGSLLLRLVREDGEVKTRIVGQEQLQDKRADQVLASEAFGLVTTRSPGSVDDPWSLCRGACRDSYRRGAQ
jgi:predicted ATP-dependent endonuclease of OLD family